MKLYYKGIGLMVLCFIALPFEVQSQRARLFSTDMELSNSLIQEIFQDHKGIVWIATEDGLNKYDGNKFTIYKQERDGILDNYVRRLYEDSQRNLYIGYFNGLQIYDRARDSFTKVPLILESGVEYSAHVLTIVERKNGEVWVGTSGHGIFVLETAGDSLIGRQHEELVPSYFINRIFEDSKGKVWILTQDQGLFILGDSGHMSTPDIGDKNSLISICEDKDGNIFVGSLNSGLLKYNEALGDFQVIPTNSKFNNLAVVTLHVTNDNNVLVGTDGEGLKLFDPATSRMSDLNFNVSNFDFTKTKVHDIMQDESGNYWLGLFQKGVVLIPSRINNFRYIGYQSVSHDIIGSNYIISLMKGREEELWVGTDSDGLYKILPPDKPMGHFSRENISGAPQIVMCMLEDSKGNFWIGSYIEGLIRFDEENEVFTKFQKILNSQGNPISRITDIVEDQNGTVWIATLGFGVYSIDIISGMIKNYSGRGNPYHSNNAINNIHNSWINCLMASSDNKMYIGTVDGVTVYDIGTKTFRLLNDINGLLWGKAVVALYEDKEGLIWLGTGGGLFSYDPGSDSLVNYTMDDGLPNNVICSIEEDDSGNLWVSTNYGMSKFDVKSKLFRNYYYHDGLQGNEFSKRASVKTDDGQLYFAGINGITYFDPATIETPVDSIEVEIVGFYIQDKAVKKGMKSGDYNIINTALIDADTFHLSHDDNSYSIEFSSMEYLNPGRINYYYSMNNSDWIALQYGTNHVAFNNLKPGQYTFRVRGQDFNTFSDIRSILIIIHPPWYQSGWAKFGYFTFFLALFVAIGIYIKQRSDHRKRLREHMQTRRINEAKLEFFTNISHEIRTPLSLIINPIRKLISTDADVGRQRSYNVIRRNTEKVLHLVNQLMDLRQIDRGKIDLKFRRTDIVAFIKEATEIFEESLIAKHIDFRIHYDSEVPEVWIDQNYFDKTIQNVLSNAIKFTPENGKIHFEVSVDEQTRSLVITCIDSGVGLKEADLEKIFDRFYQVKSSKLDSVGNGIGLHLTRSIVDLHHGTIRAENNEEGPGCRFIIKLPLGNEHLKEHEIDLIQPGIIAKRTTPVPEARIEKHTEQVKSKTKWRVLVVDDDEEIRKYIHDELIAEYHVLESVNGKEGLAVVLEKKPDLVISDVVMPEMDGINLCKKIKHNVNVNHIPVVLLTARAEEKDNLEGLGIGADAYITKPFNMEILKKTVDNLVRNRELLKNNFSGSQQQDDKVKHLEMKSADEKLLQKVMDVINSNFDNPELNVEMIAQEIGISRVHLYRKLKELTNQSVRDLIKNIRLKQAADLLLSKNLGVSEVAYATGFSNPSKFSSSFKQFYGVSPSAYVEREKSKGQDKA